MERQTVSIRDLRNRGGDVVALAAAGGEPITITRDGQPVAELRALPPVQPSAADVVARWRGAPEVDLAAMRRDADAIIDSGL